MYNHLRRSNSISHGLRVRSACAEPRGKNPCFGFGAIIRTRSPHSAAPHAIVLAPLGASATIWCVLALAAMLILLSACNRVRAGEPVPELARILATWEQRRANTNTVQYEVTGQVMVPKGRYNDDVAPPKGSTSKDVPSTDYKYNKTLSLLLDFAKNRFRRDCRDEILHGDFGTFHAQHIIRTFDGVTFKVFKPRQDNAGGVFTPSLADPDLGLGNKDLTPYRGPYIEYDEIPLFFGHGIFVNTAPDPRALRKTIDLQKLRLHGHGVQDGKQRTVLRTAPNKFGDFDELWVDLDRAAVITRWLGYRSTFLETSTDVEYQRIAEEWVPLSWKMTYYFAKGHIDASYEHRVVKYVRDIAIDPTLLQLEREKKPGMVVKDNSADGGLYQVQENGALAPLRFTPDGRPIKPSNWLRFVLGGCLLFVLLLICVWAARKFTGMLSRT